MPQPIRTLVVPIVEKTWRACIDQRLGQMRGGPEQALLVECLSNARYVLDRSVLADAHDVMDLADATLRLPLPGLCGGMHSSKSQPDLQTVSSQVMPGSSRSFARLVPNVDTRVIIDLDPQEQGETSKKTTRLRDKEAVRAHERARYLKRKNTERYKQMQKERDAKRKTTEKYKETKKKSDAKIDAKRKATEKYKATQKNIDAKKKQTGSYKAKRSAKRSTAMGQLLRSTAAFRLRETKRLRRSADAQSNKAIAGRRSKHCQRIQYARAARENEVVAEGGSWQQAARAVAVSDGSAALPIMPPSFAGLNDAQCLNDISQMYGFLQDTAWHTCVVCWRAWYVVNMDFPFRKADSRNHQRQQWFHPRRSVVLGAE